jgi:hypothetical protein
VVLPERGCCHRCWQVEVKAKRGDVLFYDILTAHSGSENLASGAAEKHSGTRKIDLLKLCCSLPLKHTRARCRCSGTGRPRLAFNMKWGISAEQQRKLLAAEPGHRKAS